MQGLGQGKNFGNEGQDGGKIWLWQGSPVKLDRVFEREGL